MCIAVQVLCSSVETEGRGAGSGRILGSYVCQAAFTAPAPSHEARPVGSTRRTSSIIRAPLTYLVAHSDWRVVSLGSIQVSRVFGGAR
jgi:hypothetical protein